MPTNRHSKMPRPLDTLDPHQAGELLRLLPSTLARQARMGKVAVIKVGKLNRFPAEEIRRLILEGNTKATAEKLIPIMNKMVEDNNAIIKKEALSAGRKD